MDDTKSAGGAPTLEGDPLELARQRLADFEASASSSDLIARLRAASPLHPFLLVRTLAGVLTGVCGGLSWIFVFRAIQLADVSKVAPIDKLSMPLAIVLAVVILGERPTTVNWLGVALIVAGAYLATIPARA